MKNVFLVVGLVIASFVAYNFYSASETPNTDGIITDVDPTDYFISVQATPISDYVVSLVVTTNIPLPVEVMAGVSAKGLAPTDTFIGVSERIKLTSPEQTIELDGRPENLPSGEYTADVTFYPRWGAENGTEQAKTIQHEIIGAVDVTLSGSGENRDQADQRNVAQKWVMENVSVGTAWNEDQFVQRMGPFEKSASTLNLHDAFFFPEADMTIVVSRVNNTVATWRFGEATH
ncbi:hypothetical protein SAMN04488040_1835 [Sulfitobacter marinus]|uniref:Uncharacterized protein n=1 Tax=Sulfitobacter marinus TaxID=394264 RepID=A0A1I6SC00_9RHOB|nr:hypothetical protein [Sulfitobacter marinus]SFS74454.1 hypothetical protein SAMN04488040_1835 [Sulfitobacter marinus]